MTRTAAIELAKESIKNNADQAVFGQAEAAGCMQKLLVEKLKAAFPGDTNKAKRVEFLKEAEIVNSSIKETSLFHFSNASSIRNGLQEKTATPQANLVAAAELLENL